MTICVADHTRTEKNFRRIMGYRELWTRESILSESQLATTRQAVA